MAKFARPFSIRRFILLVGLQLSMLLVGIRVLFSSTWSHQVAAGPGAFVLALIGMKIIDCFFEWFFHRYILHGVVHPWFIRFSRGHRHHHALTPIKLGVRVEGTAKRIVLNRYPITEESQFEDAAFPPYALLAFWAFFTPLLFVIQQLLPAAPVYLGGYAAITLSMVDYEVFHAVEHYPYEWWKVATEHPRFGWLWRRIYGFHHFHHANTGSNEAISGFFGLPVADWIFGTYHQPPELLLHDRLATAADFGVKPPRRFIVWLDNWARRRETKIRRQYPERFVAHST